MGTAALLFGISFCAFAGFYSIASGSRKWHLARNNEKAGKFEKGKGYVHEDRYYKTTKNIGGYNNMAVWGLAFIICAVAAMVLSNFTGAGDWKTFILVSIGCLAGIPALLGLALGIAFNTYSPVSKEMKNSRDFINGFKTKDSEERRKAYYGEASPRMKKELERMGLD